MARRDFRHVGMDVKLLDVHLGVTHDYAFCIDTIHEVVHLPLMTISSLSEAT
jgi:hypothetical protein